ncbi:Putative transcriptional regulator%2C WhiB family [Mycobacteroides abscessus]|nr:Putative transcriptional regulator%2C WhiB family [Mycobacteroides abscessus]
MLFGRNEFGVHDELSSGVGTGAAGLSPHVRI